MSQDVSRTRRFDASPNEDLLDEIDTIALELNDAATATGSGRVPIAARADFLRAKAAHQRAVVIWTAASTQHQLIEVREALDQCRDALRRTRERLRR